MQIEANKITIQKNESLISFDTVEARAAAMLHIQHLEAALGWVPLGEPISYDVAVKGIVLFPANVSIVDDKFSSKLTP
jgi:hypothetical protein